MVLTIISHTPHFQKDGEFYSWGPTLRELNSLTRLFSIIFHLAPLHNNHITSGYAQIENKIKSDRDRNSFDNKLVNNFLNIWARSGFHYHSMQNNPAIQYVLEKSRKIWDKGHPLLAALANNAWNIKDDKSLKDLFGNEYLSESRYTYSREISYHDWFSTKTQNYIRSRDKKMKNNNKIMLPSYFNNFGVMSSLESFIRSKANAEKRIKNKKTADLTSKEQEAVNFCFEAADRASGGPHPHHGYSRIGGCARR